MKTALRVTAAVYLTYLLLAIVVVMPVLNFMAPRLAQEYANRELQSDLIFFNPFTLAVVARGVALPDPDGHEFVAFDEAEVNLSLASLWSKGWVLDRVLLDDLLVHVRTLPGGELSFADLLGEREEDTTDTAPTTLPGLTIVDLQFGARRLAYTDLDRDEIFESGLDGVAIAVENLSTIVEEGKPYQLHARSERNGELAWEGTVSIPGSYSEGRIQLDSIPLDPGWRFFRPMLAFELDDAELDVTARYRVDWSGDALAYEVSEGIAHLRDLKTRDSATSESRVDFTALTVEGVALDGTKQAATINTVTLDGLRVRGDTDGQQVSLAQMFTPQFPTDEEPDAAAVSEAADESQPWSVEVRRVQVPAATISFASPFTAPSRMQVNTLDLTVTNLHWPAEQTADLDLAIRLQDAADIKLTAGLVPVTATGSLNLEVVGLQVPWFSPNLPPQLKSSFSQGAIELTAGLAIADAAPVTLTSHGHLHDLIVDVEGVDQSLTQMRSLRWEELAVDFNEQHARLERLLIDGYQGRLHIFEDGSVNAQRAWQEAAADAEAEAKAEQLAEQAAAEAAGETEEAPGTMDWTAELPIIRFTDSSLDFMDESLPIRFQTVIGNLQGEITGISTDPGHTAEIDLEGLVDEYAPVVLAGTVRPFDEPLALDLGLSFTGVDMVTLTPYAGNYAGYQIDRGLLNLQLKYGLEQQHLVGDNAVVIKQLKLGQKVESEDAADLPLNLAIALLSDSNGVIDLAVPVSGDVDDPEFEIGGVIAKAFMNAIVKIVTAPFSLLAGLVGSEEDLETVSFPPGEARVNTAGEQKLQSLADALGQRPQLSLGVSGRGGSEQDLKALRQAVLNEQLYAAGLNQEQVSNRDKAWAEQVTRMYQANPPPPDPDAPEAEPPSATQMHRYLRAQIPVSDNQLLELAQARAAETKRYLVIEKGIVADRIFLDAPEIDETMAGVTMRVDG